MPHPLRPADLVKRFPQLAEDSQRRAGRTTAQALELIAKCIRNPYTWETVKDHHGTRRANEFQFKQVQCMVKLLGLQHFEFTVQDSAYLVRFGKP